MNTTAGRRVRGAVEIYLSTFRVGSFALLDSVVPRDATVAAKLRASGAVTLDRVYRLNNTGT